MKATSCSLIVEEVEYKTQDPERGWEDQPGCPKKACYRASRWLKGRHREGHLCHLLHQHTPSSSALDMDQAGSKAYAPSLPPPSAPCC